MVEPVQERFEELLRLLDENPEFLEALQDRIVDEKAILRAFQKRAEMREAIRRQNPARRAFAATRVGAPVG